jgi:hypothetical protein
MYITQYIRNEFAKKKQKTTLSEQFQNKFLKNQQKEANSISLTQKYKTSHVPCHD